MATQYDFILRNQIGTIIDHPNDFFSLAYTQKDKEIGTLTITLPIEYYFNYHITRDFVLEVWRKPDTGNLYLEFDTVWFIRRVDLILDKNGNLVLKLKAYDAKSLLRRRTVLFAAESTQAQKTAPADNMAKDIVTENTVYPRNFPNFTVQNKIGAGNTLSKGFSNRNVFEVIKEITETSSNGGNFITFDIYCTSGLTNTFEFRTYKGQRGIDRSNFSIVILDTALGNLVNITRAFDYTDEVTAAVAGGSGQGSERVISPVQISNSAYASNYNYIEAFIDARSNADLTSITNEAQSYLRSNRGKQIFTATIQDTPVFLYGVNYNYGDIVPVQFIGEYINCRINAISVVIEKNEEKVLAQLESVDL